MAKSHLIHVRFSEPELARVLQQEGPSDRSTSDIVRRLLALACDTLESRKEPIK